MTKIRCGGLDLFTSSSVLELSCEEPCSIKQLRSFIKVTAITGKNAEQVLPLISSDAPQLIYSSLMSSVPYVLLRMQSISLKPNHFCRKMVRSECPRSSSTSLICPFLKSCRLFVFFFFFSVLKMGLSWCQLLLWVEKNCCLKWARS